jgi:hypothetical protein
MFFNYFLIYQEHETIRNLKKGFKARKIDHANLHKNIAKNKKKVGEHCANIAKSGIVGETAVSRFIYDPLTMYNDEKGLQEMANLEFDEERVYAELLEDDDVCPREIFKEEKMTLTEEDEEAIHREWVDRASASTRERAARFIETLSGKKEFKHFNLRSRGESAAPQLAAKSNATRSKKSIRNWEPLSVGTIDNAASIYPRRLIPEKQDRFSIPKPNEFIELLD